MVGRGDKSSRNASSVMEVRKHKRELRERLLYEAHNLSHDPNLVKDSTGRYVCVLCRTKHLTELSYVKHREGKRHLRRLSMKEGDGSKVEVPRYQVMSLVRGDSRGYAVVVNYERAEEMPSYRFVSGLEQNVEELSEDFRYLVFVCRPYGNIGFKFENRDVEGDSVYEDIDEESGTYRFHFYFSDVSVTHPV